MPHPTRSSIKALNAHCKPKSKRIHNKPLKKVKEVDFSDPTPLLSIAELCGELISTQQYN
jgi:hypothetical protein